MKFAYDFDGVLVETRLAIHKSYMEAGVMPPHDFWCRPWQSWLKDKSIYEQRNKNYLKNLHLVQPLPMLEVFKSTRGLILTSGAEERVSATLSYFGIMFPTIKCGLTIDEKVIELNSTDPGIFFEDHLPNAETLRKETKWKIVHVNQF